MRRARLGACLAAAAGLAAADGEAWNQTVVRERLERIVTIDGDLRRDGPSTAPGLPWPAGWGSLRLAGESSAVAWPADAPPAGGAPLRERRSEVQGTWRQPLGTPWITLETTARGARSDRTDAWHLGDLETLLVVPLWRRRYHGVALALGALTPLADDGEDWLRSHGTLDESSWTGKAELRGSFGIGLGALQVRAGAEHTPTGVNELPGRTGDAAVADTFTALHGAVGATWRLTRWLRLGAEQAWTRRTWRDRDDEPAFKAELTSAPLVGRCEITPWPGLGLHLEGWAGSDLATRDELDADDRLVVGASLLWVY